MHVLLDSILKSVLEYKVKEKILNQSSQGIISARSFGEEMMFTKKYLKTRPICKVHFKVLKKNIGQAESVKIIGEFNDWNLEAPTAMKKLKSGDFSCTIDLASGRDYQFRYLVDGKKWINDENADTYLPSPFPGIDNSVITI